MLFKTIKFSVSGVIGLIIDMSITFALREWLSFSPYLSTALGLLISVIVMFHLHKYWTFLDKARDGIRIQFFKFFIIAMLGCVWNIILVYLFFGLLNMDFYMAKVLATLSVAFWNFWMNSLITFRTVKTEK